MNRCVSGNLECVQVSSFIPASPLVDSQRKQLLLLKKRHQVELTNVIITGGDTPVPRIYTAVYRSAKDDTLVRNCNVAAEIKSGKQRELQWREEYWTCLRGENREQIRHLTAAWRVHAPKIVFPLAAPSTPKQEQMRRNTKKNSR